MKHIHTKIAGVVLGMTLLFSGAPAYAQSQHDLLRAQLIDLITQLIEQLQDELQEQLDAENKSTTSSKPKLTVDGYHPIGSDDQYAKVTFTIPVKAAGDTDLEFDNYNAFIFEVDGVEYTGAELNDGTTLPGYNVTIEDSDDNQIDSGYILRDGQSETFIIKIIVDATETDQGTGEYEIELDEIQYHEIESGRNSKLPINLDSDPIDLLA